MKRWIKLWLLTATSFAVALDVPTIRVQDTINPGTADYIQASLADAERAGAPLFILQLDTPGGLLTSTRQIVQAMLNSKIPVVVFIGPRGAQAGSAGALITFAADVAVMATGSNIGAAHPVTAGGEKEDDTMKEKITNDTAAFAESLARAKGRNAEWAIRAVKRSASIPAEEAARANVVDFLADDLDALLKALEGRTLRKPKGEVTRLPSEPLTAKIVEPSIKQRLVSFFSNPSLAYLIMTLGGLCLWIELSHPGLILPGTLGAICLLISLISFQMVPIDYGALALIFAGMGLIIAELFLPTFGILGVGGTICFVLGSLFLVDSSVPELQISPSVILPTVGVLIGSALTLSYVVLSSRNARIASGLDAMLGEIGEAREEISASGGKVFVHGELWNAVCEGNTIPAKCAVKIAAIRDLTLVVEAIEEKE